MADMTMSCAVEDRVHRAEMPARTTSETAACAREGAEAYVCAQLPSVKTDRTSKRANDHDAVDGSRSATRTPYASPGRFLNDQVFKTRRISRWCVLFAYIHEWNIELPGYTYAFQLRCIPVGDVVAGG